MRLGSKPLRVRIEAEGPDASGFLARTLEAAREGGLVLVAPGEEADLVARIPGPPARAPRTPGRDGRPSTLSPREIEILDYLVDGWSNAEIASALRIGIRTVRFHLGNIYGNLGVARRGEAVREAVRLGLVRFDM